MATTEAQAKDSGLLDDVEASADEVSGGEGRSGDEGDEGGDGENADEGEGGDDDAAKKKKRVVRKRRTAADLNLLRDPEDVIVELTEPVLQELAGHSRKLHQLRYPTYIVCTHRNFQLRAIEGLVAIKGTALKELDLSNNKLMVLDALEQFSTLKTLKATRNLIAEVTIERLPRLRYLDLSHNKLDGIPDLSGFKALAFLNLSHNLIGTRPDSETSRDGYVHCRRMLCAWLLAARRWMGISRPVCSCAHLFSLLCSLPPSLPPSLQGSTRGLISPLLTVSLSQFLTQLRI